ALREARRRQRRRRKRDGKRGEKCADPHHGRSPFIFLARIISWTRDRVRVDRVNPKAAPSRGRNGPQSQKKTPDSVRPFLCRAGAARHRGSISRLAAGLSCLNSWNRRMRKHYEIVMCARIVMCTPQTHGPGTGEKTAGAAGRIRTVNLSLTKRLLCR